MCKRKEGVATPLLVFNVIAGVLLVGFFFIVRKRQKALDEKIESNLHYAFDEEEYENMYKPLYEHYKEDSEYYSE